MLKKLMLALALTYNFLNIMNNDFMTGFISGLPPETYSNIHRWLVWKSEVSYG